MNRLDQLLSFLDREIDPKLIAAKHEAAHPELIEVTIPVTFRVCMAPGWTFGTLRMRMGGMSVDAGDGEQLANVAGTIGGGIQVDLPADTDSPDDCGISLYAHGAELIHAAAKAWKARR